MSSAKSAGVAQADLIDVLNSKSVTPTTVTRTSKVTKKRNVASIGLGDEGEDGPIEMDIGASLHDVSPMRRLASDSPSPLPNHVFPNDLSLSPRASHPPTSVNPHLHAAPAVAARAPAQQQAFRDLFNNLSTCIRLTPAVPPGRMELVQTGIKLELAISNLSRAASRGLEEYVNERAAGFYERPQFTVERIKLYSQAGEVVLFGKIGTAYDVRALHYLFCDLAKGSQLRFCPSTFPDLATAVENARPWFTQGESHTYPSRCRCSHIMTCACLSHFS